MEETSGKEGSREQIIQAAAELFAERGFTAVSMRDLGRAVEMTPASLYYYFPGKDVLYRDVLTTVFAGVGTQISAIAASNASPIEKLETLLAWMGTLFASQTTISNLLRRELLDGDDVRLAFIAKHIFQDMEDDILSFARDARPDLDAGLLATSAVSLVFGYYGISGVRHHLKGTGNRFDDPQIFAKFITNLLLQRPASQKFQGEPHD
mgnify:CR=1 FL=1